MGGIPIAPLDEEARKRGILSGGLPPAPNNPVLDHIDSQWSSMHPLGQQAVARGIMGATQPQAAPMAAPPQQPVVGSSMQPQAPAASPAPISGPVQARPIAPENPDIAGKRKILTDTQNEGSGISRLPLAARIPLGILDAVGSGFFPNVAANIPGTSAHHQQLLHQRQGAVDEAEAAATAQGTRNKQQFDIDTEGPQRAAQTRNLNSEANARDNPPPVPETFGAPVATDKGLVLPGHSGTAKPLQLNGETLQPTEKQGKSDIHTMYADAVSDAFERGVDPASDPKVQQLQTSITALQKQPADKTQQRDDRAIEIYSKPEGQRTPEEMAYLKGYENWVNKTKVQPGMARMEIMANTRVVPVVDPNNPQNVVYMPSGEAGRTGAQATQSIPFQAAAGTAKSFTSGSNATTVTNINTAHEHIAQLQKVAEALHNGDIPLVNQLSNAYARATGQPAPANFQLVKTAVEGEIAKTFTGGVATVEEGKKLGEAINAANSPAQLRDVLAGATQLMESKRGQLKQQFTQGMQGKPNFGEGGGPPTVASQAEYDALPKGAIYLEDGKQYRKP